MTHFQFAVRLQIFLIASEGACLFADPDGGAGS